MDHQIESEWADHLVNTHWPIENNINSQSRAVVVAQLVERSLPILDVCGSNPVIRKIYLFLLNICLLSTVYWKDKNKEKEAGDGPFFNSQSKKLYLE